jgi:hypothetical protein
MKAQSGSRHSPVLSLTSALDEGVWLTPHPGHFTPPEITLYCTLDGCGKPRSPPRFNPRTVKAYIRNVWEKKKIGNVMKKSYSILPARYVPTHYCAGQCISACELPTRQSDEKTLTIRPNLVTRRCDSSLKYRVGKKKKSLSHDSQQILSSPTYARPARSTRPTVYDSNPLNQTEMRSAAVVNQVTSGKVSSVDATKKHRGRRTAPTILNLGTRALWPVNITLRPLHSGTHWPGGCVGPTAGLDIPQKTKKTARPCRNSNPGTSNPPT